MARLFLAALCITALGGCATSSSNRTAPSTTTSESTTATSASGASTTIACSNPTGGTDAAGSKEVNPPGDIPDDQAFVPYRPPGGEYTIKVPEGWARMESPPSVTFTDKFNTVHVELVNAAQAPTVESAQAETAGIGAAVPCFKLRKVTIAPRRSGPAVLTTYQARGTEDPVTDKAVIEDVERYEFWRGGVEAVITLSGAAGSDNVDPWKLVTDSFAWG